MTAPRLFGTALLLPAVLAVSGCLTTPAAIGTEAEAEVCRAWADTLPTRSRQDTAQTQAEIGAAYDAYAAACGG